VYSFGRGDYGQLGHGDRNDQDTPTKIEGLSGIQAIAAGMYNSFVLIIEAAQDSAIYPDEASFDKNILKQQEIVVTLELKGNTLIDVRNGTTSLSKGTDYIVNGTIVTIAKKFLANLPIGTTTLVFAFSAGTDATLDITVSDSTTHARLSGIALNGVPLEHFDPGIHTYVVVVSYATEQVTVTAATYDPAANYEVVGEVVRGGVQPLKVGQNRIDILVTAEDQQETYTLHVKRQPDAEAPQWRVGDDLTVSDITRTSVKLSWPGATDNVGVSGYRIYADVDNWIPQTVTASVYEYTVTNLRAGMTYTFTVKAFDDAGNESAPLSKQATTARSAGGVGGSGSGRVLSDNADLGDLQVWTGGEPLKLSPSFGPGTTAYTARTEAGQAEIVVKEAHSAAKVMLDDQVVTGKVNVGLVEGSNVFVLTVQAENGTKKTYTLTIYREMREPYERIIDFADIAGHWAESDIKSAAAKGIVSGYPGGAFKPDHPVTRAEFVAMLAGAMKLEGSDAALTFTDYGQIGGWAKPAVAQAVQAGIVAGYSDGSFRPNTPVTRAEMAVMIAKATGVELTGHAQTNFADDAHIPAWAKSYVEEVRIMGIIHGRDSNLFAPHEPLTRAEAESRKATTSATSLGSPKLLPIT